MVFLGYALAFYVGMLLRYNDEKNPATGEATVASDGGCHCENFG